MSVAAAWTSLSVSRLDAKADTPSCTGSRRYTQRCRSSPARGRWWTTYGMPSLGDLPYGIQHIGEVSALLSKVLPVWERLLMPGGNYGVSLERDAY